MLDMNNEMCTGCGACISSCPFDAITFVENGMGFTYPEVDESRCRQCNICNKVCPISKQKMARVEDYYIVQNRNRSQRFVSQSGGLFSALAEVIISRGGVCYGVTLNEKFIATYTCVENVGDLWKIQGSKYVQSASDHILEDVENRLNNNTEVLFSGTSCTIAGLYNFLRNKRISTENLYTCDLLCHGVSSPLMWHEHIVFQKSRFGELVSANFRDKKFGWRSCVETYKFANGKNIAEGFYDDLYFSHVALRDCCYNCEYINVDNKPADITMGDFFGNITAEEKLIENDDSGISVAVCHSKKGKDLLRMSNLIIYKTTAELAMKNNLKYSAKCPVWREKFWKDYKEKGYEYCLRKYTIYGGLKFKLKRKILLKLGKW